jgi:hypothetical protein
MKARVQHADALFCIVKGFTVAAFLLLIVLPRTSAEPTARLSPEIGDVERPNGWRIPGRNEFQNLSDAREMLVDGIKVKKKLYTKVTETEPLVDLDTYRIGSDGHLVVNTILCAVRNVHSYTTQDRSFAYEIGLVPVSVDINGTRHYVGVMFIVRYYDRDGNGTFETRQTNPTSFEIPKWTKYKS